MLIKIISVYCTYKYIFFFRASLDAILIISVERFFIEKDPQVCGCGFQEKKREEGGREEKSVEQC